MVKITACIVRIAHRVAEVSAAQSSLEPVCRTFSDLGSIERPQQTCTISVILCSAGKTESLLREVKGLACVSVGRTSVSLVREVLRVASVGYGALDDRDIALFMD